MTGQAAFTLRGRNPDVLTCIANLSNDEVFTPPDFAGKMLDTLYGMPSANAFAWISSKSADDRRMFTRLSWPLLFPRRKLPAPA